MPTMSIFVQMQMIADMLNRSLDHDPELALGKFGCLWQVPDLQPLRSSGANV
jgi:hypothetical protein